MESEQSYTANHILTYSAVFSYNKSDVYVFDHFKKPIKSVYDNETNKDILK